ncbi:hypothetical protein ACWGJW_41635, partial [Streptomyces nigrescens]
MIFLIADLTEVIGPAGTGRRAPVCPADAAAAGTRPYGAPGAGRRSGRVGEQRRDLLRRPVAVGSRAAGEI